MSFTQVICLASAMYFEARGEGVHGMRLVGQTVINRVHSDEFEPTICKVVHSPYQFSYLWDNKPDKVTSKSLWSSALWIAQDLLRNERKIHSACFYNRKDLSPKYTLKFTSFTYKDHTFYKNSC